MNDKIVIASAFKSLTPQRMAEGISAGGFPRISIEGKAFTLINQGQEYRFLAHDEEGTAYIDVVIIGFNPFTSKVYYPPNSYNKGASSPPICASIKGDVPDPGVPQPQSKSCGICTHNEFKTLPGGFRGKECTDHKRLAVLLLPTMKTKPALSEPVLESVYFKVTPASLKSWKTYDDDLMHRNIHAATVVTRISFSQEKNWQMDFRVLQALTNDEAPRIFEMMDDPQTKNILGSIAEIREDVPSLPEPDERIETGFTAAFAKEGGEVTELTKRRGRPPGIPNKPKVVEIEAEAEPEKEEDTVSSAIAGAEESTDELDAAIAKVMQKKVSDMLK